jgi:hypothetical protein
MEDDNKLVTLSELEKEEKIITKWDENIEPLKEQMEKLKQLRFKRLPDEVIDIAINQIVNNNKWYDYESFKLGIDSIINGSFSPIPFSLRAKNKETGKLDFWMLRTFVNVEKDPKFIFNNKEYNKREVFLSKQFVQTLKKYCKETLKDEVQFWTYTNSQYGTEQKLDLDKLSQNDKILLNIMGDSNPDHLILFQFKKKSPEVFIGKA